MRKAIAERIFILLIRGRTIAGIQAFLRVFSGQLAMKITGGRKGNKLLERFWDARPFTRLVNWGTDFSNVVDYIFRNILETAQLVSYKPRTVPKMGTG